MERLPLGEYSKSAMNTLGSSGPVLTTSFHDNTAIGNGPILPSIKSLINLRQETDVGVGSNLMSKSFDNHINRLRYNHLMPLTLRYDAPLVKSQTTVGALINESAIDSNIKDEKSTVHRQEDLRKYFELSKKLQIRLQFAYYKYKTKQTELKFNDLKERQNLNNQKGSKSKRVTKRRKLMVSQGNFKTPAKRKDHKKFLNHSQDTSIETSLSSNASSLMSKRDSTLHYEEDCDTTNDFTTPVRPSNVLQKSIQKQDTPMSVKAAKSLIFLYSSRT
ncbi:Nrm1p [Nakaseomyces bracarensis]|uniref:Nrm1p n=1 Tax=Nakaseomyces bracarensis TaxID=273131 RepID=UPI0038719874